MEKELVKTFDKCPMCGSAERLCEAMGEEVRAKGLCRKEWVFHYDIRDGVVTDTKKLEAIKTGDELPTYVIMTDICLNCGCVYAVKIVKGNVRKPPPLIVPNRAQRRRDLRQGGGGILPPSAS